jgi:hypothetical protein
MSSWNQSPALFPRSTGWRNCLSGWRIVAKTLPLSGRVVAKSRNQSSSKFQLLTAPKHFIVSVREYTQQGSFLLFRFVMARIEALFFNVSVCWDMHHGF